jgi:hypothetical protein
MRVSRLSPQETPGAAAPTAGAAVASDPRHAHALALQRAAGNRATQLAISREIRTIQGEAVHVRNDSQAAAADRIITRIRRRYGIRIRSGQLVKSTKARYSKAPAAERMKVKKRHWHLRELRALEKACKHYAPILGKLREDSTRKDAGQEVKYFGKATHSIDTNTASGIADSSTLGEYYRSDSTAGMYMIAENDTSFGTDVDASLEWVCTHELSHGLMDYVEEDLRKAAGYWKDASTKTGSGEEPWSGYAKTSLGEDLAESATAYFIKNADFKKKCPKRYAVIDAAVKGWKKAPAPAAASAAAGAAAGAAAAGVGAAAGAAVAGAAAAATGIVIGGHRP